MTDKIYTPEEKVKKLSAWHEMDKKQIATLEARIKELEAALGDVTDPAFMREHIYVKDVYVCHWCSVETGSGHAKDCEYAKVRAILEVTK